MIEAPVVYVVDDDPAIRDSLSLMLQAHGLTVVCYPDAEAFLAVFQDDHPACLLLDVRMPGMSGLELQQQLKERDIELPIIFLSGHADVPTSVSAMRFGAEDFLEKPFRKAVLLERIHEALTRGERLHAEQQERRQVLERFSQLTPREREVIALVVAGKSNKQIAQTLGTSHRTVDVHRSRVMKKMETETPQELAAVMVRFGLLESPP